jgi:F-type H+/Na+-transporting ATPase subunit alpha
MTGELARGGDPDDNQPEPDPDRQLETSPSGEQAPGQQTDKPDQDKKDRNMAELTIRPEEIRDALERFVETYEPGAASTEEVGAVVECGDGIARVSGLPSVMANELLEFEDGTRGLALNLDIREIGVVVLGDFSGIEEGQRVKRTGEVLSVPVGDGFLGRVVDPLGVPLDGLGPIQGVVEDRQLELQAPSVVQRRPVTEPLQTGIKAIDAMTPVGRGQRELIIGDRQTGKTTIAIDTIINQKQNWDSGDPTRQVRCIYVAVGQKGSTISAVRAALEDAGALEYSTIVMAPASDPAGYKYIAPYTGSALGQHWMYQGKHVLIVFDDLTKQAEAYRAISLLLRRPPGREAYPGDVFYLHSRLLERCAKLSDELGGGSLTGLPIVETKANDISAYIPTNVISITDGQIFLETDLFNSGVRPAINVGQSVSRVGGNAQIKAMKTVAGGLKLALSQYRDLEAFASFASDLDPASRAQLDRGARLVELLKQPQYHPFPVERQVVSVWAGTEGYLDDVPVEDVRRFESEFLDEIARSRPGIYDAIRETKVLSEDTVTALKDTIGQFRATFEKSDGELLVVPEEPAEPLVAGQVEQEKIPQYTQRPVEKTEKQ